MEDDLKKKDKKEDDLKQNKDGRRPLHLQLTQFSFDHTSFHINYEPYCILRIIQTFVALENEK